MDRCSVGQSQATDIESGEQPGESEAIDRAPEDAHAAAGEIPLSRLQAANVSTVPQRSPLRYPGGKTWLVPHILEWLKTTKPRILIEPFAGGGIASLTAVMEPLVEQAIMMELDRDVAAFWQAALHEGDALAKRVLEFEPTLERLQKLQKDASGTVLERGFRTLVLNRTRRAGVLAEGASFIKDGENGKGLLSRWYPKTLSDRLEAIRKHADRIVFYQGDGSQVLSGLLRGRAQAAAFVDPPYTASTGKRAGTRLYAHKDIDPASIFELLAQARSNFLMTYDNAPEIVQLIRKHEFHAVSVEMKNAHHDRLRELVITRDPLFT